MDELINSLIADPDRTNALAAVANVLLASFALVVAAVSIVLSILTLKRQTKHNKLSVKPIPFIACADYLDRLRVKIYNNGTGPFIISKLSVVNEDEERPDIISWMPPTPKGLFWTNFTSAIEGRSIQPSDGLNLIELVGEYSDPAFKEFRRECRSALKDLTVRLEYTDIYGDRFEPCTRKLDWFSR